MKQLGEFTEQTLLPAVSTLLTKQSDEFGVKLKQQSAELRDAMDEKNADLKGDLIILMRKEDRKLGALVTILKDKQILSEPEADQILSLEPFPKS